MLTVQHSFVFYSSSRSMLCCRGAKLFSLSSLLQVLEMRWVLVFSFLAIACQLVASQQERINHEGRILGPLLIPSTPLLFNGSASDAVMSSLQIFPRDNPWNEDISRLP